MNDKLNNTTNNNNNNNNNKRNTFDHLATRSATNRQNDYHIPYLREPNAHRFWPNVVPYLMRI